MKLFFTLIITTLMLTACGDETEQILTPINSGVTFIESSKTSVGKLFYKQQSTIVNVGLDESVARVQAMGDNCVSGKVTMQRGTFNVDRFGQSSGAPDRTHQFSYKNETYNGHPVIAFFGTLIRPTPPPNYSHLATAIEFIPVASGTKITTYYYLDGSIYHQYAVNWINGDKTCIPIDRLHPSDQYNDIEIIRG